MPTGVAVNDRLYTIRDEGVLTCYEIATGKRVWAEWLAGSFTASLVAGDGKLYATSERGVTYVVATADKFKLLATNRLDEHCLATPAIAGDELFVRAESQLYCTAAPLQPSVVAEQDESPSASRSHSPLATTTSADVSLTTSTTPSPISPQTPVARTNRR